MDMFAGAAYFDRQQFDCYNFGSSSWDLAVFKGQLKTTNTNVSPLNRSTRIRMLYCTPASRPNSPVIRVPQSSEILLVGNDETDVHANVQYRVVINLHKATGAAVIHRLDAGIAGSRTWATNTLVQNTFADQELRDVNTSQANTVFNYGEFTLFLPNNAPLQRHDTVTLNGYTYYVYEVYPDSGFLSARVSIRPDERVNFTYSKIGAQTYDSNTATISAAKTNYNVTAKLSLQADQEVNDSEVYAKTARVLIQANFIDFQPALNDQIGYLGKVYKVVDVQRDANLLEWHLIAQQGGSL